MFFHHIYTILQCLYYFCVTGSHNSFSFSLDPSGGVAVDQPGSIRNLGSLCCGAGLSVIRKWSQTQSLSFRQQLNLGIRYFDLRVCTKPGTTEILFIHGLYGDSVLSRLREINAFMDENPREFIFLDFNHFYNMAPAAHQHLLEAIRKIFGEKLLDTQSYRMASFFTLTLENIWTTSKRLMVFYHEDRAIGTHIHVWPRYAVRAPWPNTNNTTVLHDFLETNYIEQRRPNSGQFCVWQGILTPTTKNILSNAAGSLKESVAPSATNTFLGWIRNKLPGPQGINICLADFVEMFDFTPTVINLNHKIPQ